MNNRIKSLIEMTLDDCLPWIENKDGAVQFIDPLDKIEISAHYGATHMAAALIIYGDIKNDAALVAKGEELLFSVLDRWDNNKTLKDFHHDFNSFALCVLDSYTPKYHDRIKDAVMGTRDTFFDTVNWLPMRWFVNRARYDWTQDSKYKEVCRSCAEKIKQATFSDGFIDDMIPKGRSFSLQYDVATVAFMQYLRVMGEDIDLSLETGALLNAVCPDGDINYFGRGTNQIFAWGLWIYLLASSGQNELGRALAFLEERLPATLANNNIMLNDYPGDEKYMWWDYHFCSVYTSHLLFWLVLALRDYGRKTIEPRLITDGSSGIRICRNSSSFVVTFEGRSEYLAESGPAVAAIWTEDAGVVCKGSFGPWYGLFGNKYRQEGATPKNFFGFFVPRRSQNVSAFKKLISRLHADSRRDLKMANTPLYLSPVVDVSDKVIIRYKSDEPVVILNLPVLGGNIRVSVNGQDINMNDDMKVRNQYGRFTLKQRLIESAGTIEMEIYGS